MNWIKQFNWNRKKTENELEWHKQFVKAIVNEINMKRKLHFKGNKRDNQSDNINEGVVVQCDCKFCMDIIVKQFEKQKMLDDE